MGRKGGEAGGHESGLVRLAPDLVGQDPEPPGRDSGLFQSDPGILRRAPARVEAAIVHCPLEMVLVGPKPGRVGREHAGARSDEAEIHFAEVGVRTKDVRVGPKVLGVAFDAFGGPLDELGF
jgi:hypothetical protein